MFIACDVAFRLVTGLSVHVGRRHNISMLRLRSISTGYGTLGRVVPWAQHAVNGARLRVTRGRLCEVATRGSVVQRLNDNRPVLSLRTSGTRGRAV